jgi:hypothetical protein
MSNDRTYNGHKNYDYWNVALWLGNDEGLYTFARQLNRAHPTKKSAARAFVQAMQDMGTPRTPDGAAYSANNVEAALSGLFEEDNSDE